MPPQSEAEHVPNIHLISCFGVDREHQLIPHFVEHYLGLGIPPKNFHIILQTVDSTSSRLREAQDQLENLSVQVSHRWIAPYTSRTMWQQRRKIQQACVPPVDWVVNADLDELHEYPDSLKEVVRYCDAKNIEIVQGVMIDRFAAGGRLATIDEDRSLWDQFPIAADLMCSIVGSGEYHGDGGTVKLMLHRANHYPRIGGHGIENHAQWNKFLIGRPLGNYPSVSTSRFRFAYPFKVHHFKWNASVGERLRKRLETPGISDAGREYDGKILRLVDGVESIDLPERAILSRSYRITPNHRWKRSALCLRWPAKAVVLRHRIRAGLGKIWSGLGS